MLTSPTKEAAAMARDQKAATTPKPELKTEILEKIGEVMNAKGIEFTKERRKEMWRNLRKEEVVKTSGEETRKWELNHRSRDVDGDCDFPLEVGEEWSDDDEWEEQDKIQRLGLDKIIGDRIEPKGEKGEVRR